MTGETTSATTQSPESIGDGAGRGRRRWPIVVAVSVLVAAGALTVVGDVFDGGVGSGRPGDNGSETSLARVQRRSLSTQTQFNGTLGYAGSHTVLAQAQGTVTSLPKIGQIIHDGQVLYRVDQAPVVLLNGSIPAYRTLAEGARAGSVTGADVAQLNHDLVALGYVDRSDVDSTWDEFDSATRLGVEKLQQHLAVAQTGELDRGDVVFLPTPARITSLQVNLGAPAAGPVLSASSMARTVSVALEPDLRSDVKKGDRVTITLPEGNTTPGTVTSVARVATISSNNSGGSEGGPTVPVQIRPTHPKAGGGLDQALVEVSITDQTVHDVLAVPVTALLARSGGGYSVEVVAADRSHELVRVRPGLFDDAAGMVQVSGSRLRAGQRVVVPGNQ